MTHNTITNCKSCSTDQKNAGNYYNEAEFFTMIWGIHRNLNLQLISKLKLIKYSMNLYIQSIWPAPFRTHMSFRVLNKKKWMSESLSVSPSSPPFCVDFSHSRFRTTKMLLLFTTSIPCLGIEGAQPTTQSIASTSHKTKQKQNWIEMKKKISVQTPPKPNKSVD